MTESVDNGDADGGQDEGDVNGDLPKEGLLVEMWSVDEGLEKVNGRDADDCHAEFYLQNVSVDVREPVWLVGMPV